jgi:hypothetical protein
MTEKPSKVLLAGIERGPFEALAPFLDRQNLEIERVDSPGEAVERASTQTYAMVIFDAEPGEMALDELVSTLRAPSSASRGCSLLLIAEPGTPQAARYLVGSGVNRVMYLNDSERHIERQVADLLSIAPRAEVRCAARLYTSLDDGVEEVFGQTSNVSLTGMLVQTQTLLELGQRVTFEILLEGTFKKLTGLAEIVRHASPGNGGVVGIGVRFLKFKGHGRGVLSNALENAFSETLDECLDA